MERKIDKKVFAKLLRSKERELVYTVHSIERARKRNIIDGHEDTIPRFERDTNENKPYLVVEQDSEHTTERKFKVYYQAPEGGFIAYIIALNSQTRLISVYRTSKAIQQKLYQYERAMMKKR